MKKILECVPNFSEGRNSAIISEITTAIESVKGIDLLGVEPGKSANRTVVTFVGEPNAVVEAAFRAIKKAGELINMGNHRGEHPCFGATDVCPLVPVANIGMAETVEYARKLAKRVGEELQIPVFCYEYAASAVYRRSLANCRAGGYEGLKKRICTQVWKPDFGPTVWDLGVARTGAVAIGARDFLVAYNINLNTTSPALAKAVAADVRESGRPKREDKPTADKIAQKENGTPTRIPGTLKKTRAIGWYIEEYGRAQVSMNLTGINTTPVHVAFEEVCEKASLRGIRVTGSELVGLIPLKAMLDAGKYFLQKQNKPVQIPEQELIEVAINSLGLGELAPFDPKKKIIEYVMAP